MRARLIPIALLLLLLLGLAMPTPGFAAPGDEPPTGAGTPIKHPHLDSGLAAEARAPRLAEDGGKPIRVVVEMAAGVVADGTRAGIAALGGSIEAEYQGLIQASVSPTALEGVAALPGVDWVGPPMVGVPESVTGEGVAASNASVWQTAGQTGSGVKVAIIDNGFEGYTDKQTSGDLPASLTTADYCSGNFATATNHGTGVAEIVHEMAPDAQLYLICIGTSVQLGQAVDYAIGEGVTIISHSIGWFNTSRGDGTGGPNTPEGIARHARESGILWVNSAGNYARLHWSGTFSDSDGNRYHNYAGTDFSNSFFVGAGQTFCANLKWDDWPRTAQDYDLYIVNSLSNNIIASSVNVQDGTQAPLERTCYTNNGPAQYFYAAIFNYSTTATPRLDLFIAGVGNLDYYVAAGSLNDIASSPASLAAAAICFSNDSLESYSSRGPTIDGRIKPDIAGQDSVSSATYGPFVTCGISGFTGTSAAAPHVAGAAALIKGAQPTYSPALIQSTLEGRAVDLGATGKDSSFGAGKLWLGAASVPDPAPYTLDLPASDHGMVTPSLPGPSHPSGTTVKLTANPGTGFSFIGWVVDGTKKGWANPLTITMDANHSVQATFADTAEFGDVTSGTAVTAIIELATRKAIFGYTNGNYGPNDGVQRAQMAALIARATPAGPGTPTNGILTPPACTAAESWDCEDWGNGFTDQGGVPAALWRDAGTLQHYNVAFGYSAQDCASKGRAFPCYGPTDPVSYAQTIAFIARAMIAKGYWVAQPNAPDLQRRAERAGDPGAHLHLLHRRRARRARRLERRGESRLVRPRPPGCAG
ncbi:MAG: S8 family serine peptidase [Thermomicrobiales bacterium]